jgi:outer membrane autotransporter protein
MRGDLSAKLFCFAVAAASLLSAPAIAQVQINQNFVAQGPSPITSPTIGTTYGAVQSILLDPMLGPNTMFIGTPNGGVWKTTDGGTSWKPLMHHESSLSIASLALDPTGPPGKTLIAGVGVTSSGFWGPAIEWGARPTGVLYSTDGGQNWTPMGRKELAGQSVTGVAARGGTILAATFEERAPTTTQAAKGAFYGLYRSTDGGKSFNLINSPVAPNPFLPAGPVTALVADPSSPTTFYAAFTSPTKKDLAGVYVTHDSGSSWSPVFTNSTKVTGANYGNVIKSTMDQLVFKLAAGPHGSLAIAVVDGNTNELAGLYLSQKQGRTWSTSALMGKDGVNNFNGPPPPEGVPSGVLHSVVAIGSNSTTGTPIVYVAGWDTFADPHGVPAFMVPGNCFQGACVQSLTCQQNSNSPCTPGPPGTAHADARALLVDPTTGNLLLGSDGGIYVRTDPQSNTTGAWSGLNTSTLQIGEPYAVAYGANAHRLMVALQDNGVAFQSAPSNPTYSSVQAGDGHVAVASDKTFANQSVYYTSSQTLSDLSRLVVDSQGMVVSPGKDAAGVRVTCNNIPIDKGGCATATTPAGASGHDLTLVLNGADPTRIALTSGFDVYVAKDNAPAKATSVINLSLTDVDKPGATATSAVSRKLAYGTKDLPDVLLAGGSKSLYFSPTAEAGSLNEIKDYHTLGGQTPTSLVFGVFDQSLLPQYQQHFYVADSSNLWAGTLNGTPSGTTVTIQPTLTSNLPTNIISPTSVEFIDNNGVDALLVGGLSSNAQSPIAAADSKPNGDLVNWHPFGSGLPNALVYQMAYNPLADVLAIVSVGRGIWTLYDVTSYFPQATVLQFGLANNDSVPAFLTDGKHLDGTTFVRPLEKFGSGTLTIAGKASYTGDTSIFGGTLAVNGSIVSSPSIFVYPGGTLAGTGTVGSTTVFTAGTLAPGTGVGTTGTLKVAGDLLFEPRSQYLTSVLGSMASSTRVTGKATLAGTEVSFFPGGLINTYTILSAAGGRTGTFDTFIPIGLPSFVSASLGYTATDVMLDLTSHFAGVDGLTANQTAVGSAHDQAFNTGGGIPDELNAALFGLSEGQLPSALDALSGEVYATTIGVLADDSRYVRDTILGRMIQAGYSGNGTQVVALGVDNAITVASRDDQAMGLGPRNTYAPPPQAPGLAFWTRAFGAWANCDGNVNAATASRQLGGFISGVDTGVGSSWRLGAATGFSQSSINVDARHSSADVDTIYLAGYAGGSLGPVALRSGGAWGWHAIDTSRAVVSPGFSEREEASYSGDTGQVFGEVAYPILIRSAAIEPFAGLAFVHVDTDSFHERGDVAALKGAGGNEDVGYSTLGLRVASTRHLRDMVITPHAAIAWQYVFDNLTPDAALVFTSMGTGFDITGVPLAQNSALIDVGLDLNLDPTLTLGVSYAAQFANDLQDNAVKGRFTWVF